MNQGKKILIFVSLVILFQVITRIDFVVYAQQVFKSNTVTTKVGEPTEPKPGEGTGSGGETPGAGPGDATITCPLSKDGAGSFNITCGSAYSPAKNGCGHAVPPAYPICSKPPYASCPFSPQLKASIDVRPAGSNGGGVPVYLPFINGSKSVTWNKVSGPIEIYNGATFWGVKLEYETKFEGINYRVDLTHLNRGYNTGATNSGDQVGTTLAGLDGGSSGHLHVALALNGNWVDAVGYKVCTQ